MSQIKAQQLLALILHKYYDYEVRSLLNTLGTSRAACIRKSIITRHHIMQRSQLRLLK